jgi:hypothetical protein
MKKQPLKNGGHGNPAGRPKGVPNSTSISVKNMVLGALDKLGGERWLVKVATEDPKSFMPLLSKCMPTVVAGDPENPINHAVCFLPEKTKDGPWLPTQK